MPLERQAEAMVRRGEFESFGQACAILRHRKKVAERKARGEKRVYCRVPIERHDPAAQAVRDVDVYAELERRGLA